MLMAEGLPCALNKWLRICCSKNDSNGTSGSRALCTSFNFFTSANSFLLIASRCVLVERLPFWLNIDDVCILITYCQVKACRLKYLYLRRAFHFRCFSDPCRTFFLSFLVRSKNIQFSPVESETQLIPRREVYKNKEAKSSLVLFMFVTYLFYLSIFSQQQRNRRI